MAKGRLEQKNVIDKRDTSRIYFVEGRNLRSVPRKGAKKKKR